MFWKLSCERVDGLAAKAGEAADGRFVLHRHHDAEGPHLDLRLEHDGYLSGFRIENTALEREVWATEKAPHPVEWLDRDGDAVRQDAGTYRREFIADNKIKITLHGVHGVHTVHACRQPGLSATTIRDICGVLEAHKVELSIAPQLLGDGLVARRRAIERLCGLARELDGAAFDDDVCKRSVDRLSLEDIHTQLRAYEVRFDAKYPPSPVSRPETLTGTDGNARNDQAMAILRHGDSV